ALVQAFETESLNRLEQGAPPESGVPPVHSHLVRSVPQVMEAKEETVGHVLLAHGLDLARRTGLQFFVAVDAQDVIDFWMRALYDIQQKVLIALLVQFVRREL